MKYKPVMQQNNRNFSRYQSYKSNTYLACPTNVNMTAKCDEEVNEKIISVL
jgi:hypothetical protein